MSLATWKKEFYPGTAAGAARRGAVAAVEHSLLKWTGALPKNTKKHGVKFSADGIAEPGAAWADEKSMLFFGGGSCALCQRYYKENDYDCSRCPLAALKMACGEAPDNPYDASMFGPEGPDARPMIRALKKALALVRREKEKKK